MNKEELLGVKDSIIDAIKKGIKDTEVISQVMKFGEYLTIGNNNKEKLTTNQIRKFFGEIKRQQMAGYELGTFVLLKPKLAYAVGRAKNENKQHTKCKIEDFYEVLSKAIDVVITEEINGNKDAFKNFIAIFEAIVAYHKYAEAGNVQK